jgi:hypothetical protein
MTRLLPVLVVCAVAVFVDVQLAVLLGGWQRG